MSDGSAVPETTLAAGSREILIRNERTKLTATWINGLAVAVFAVGGFAPLIVRINRSRAGQPRRVAHRARRDGDHGHLLDRQRQPPFFPRLVVEGAARTTTPQVLLLLSVPLAALILGLGAIWLTRTR